MPPVLSNSDRFNFKRAADGGFDLVDNSKRGTRGIQYESNPLLGHTMVSGILLVPRVILKERTVLT